MIPKEVKDLLEAAYYAGWNGGQRYDSGYVDHEAFEKWWSSLKEGQILSAAMHLEAASIPDLPALGPGVVVPFKEGDFVVTHVEQGWDAKVVSLQDRESYERSRRVASELWGDATASKEAPW